MIFNPQVRVVENIRILPDLHRLTCESQHIASRALPGNFVQARVGRGLDPIFRRPMSINNAYDNRFDMVFRLIGKGTKILAETEVGQIMDILGPLGNSFRVPQEDEKAVMVAGGVGYPPLHFFSKYLIEQKNYPKENILYLFGMRSIGELAMAEDVLELGIETLFSTDDGTHGYHGFVTTLFEEIYAKRLRHEKIRVYTCGPTAMMKRLAQIALSFRIPLQVSLEGAMPCGVGTCLGCAVRKRDENDYYRVCKEGPVFDAEMVEL